MMLGDASDILLCAVFGVFVLHLESGQRVHVKMQVEQLMEQGTRTRTTAATHMNANSSRSHMLIILQLKQVKITAGEIHAVSSSCPPSSRLFKRLIWALL